VKIFISGSHGFVGQKLVHYFPTRNIRAIPRALLYDLPALKNFCLAEEPTYIFHLASFGNMDFQKELSDIFLANLVATYNLLMATLEIPYLCFVYFSTSSVYGTRNDPMKETDPLNPYSFYAATKAGAEYLIKSIVQNYDKPIVIVRPFSLYGPGEASYRLIPTIIKCIVSKTPMKLAYGKHDWIYIDDLLSALLLVQENISELKGKTINIGNGIQYDNYDVLRHLCLVANCLPKDLPIDHIVKMRSCANWVSDNSLLKSLGWIPKFTLTDGLRECWKNRNLYE
jgi:dTDP-glucose 4,6-dehydratase